MRFKRPIYRYLFFAAWIAVLGGVTTLVIAANGKANNHTCKGIVVSINGDVSKIFIEKDDVLKNIEKTAKGSILKRPFGSINLGELEKSLEKNAWIRDAELYFDTKDILHVSVRERIPVARVFTTAGNSFYIDSSGFQLPLVDVYGAKLPVVTGFTETKKLSRRDSLVLTGLKNVISEISDDAFWNAQIGQIDITLEGKFELIPVIGSHVIKLGYGENVEQKLQKLLVFYKQVMPKAGLAKYVALDVQFEGQVVAVKKGATSVIDSIQLKKNIEELMKKKAAEQEPTDIVEAEPVQTFLSTDARDSLTDKKYIKENTASQGNISSPIPKKTTVQKSNPTKKTNQQKKSNVPKPKAVMPSKGERAH